MVSFYQSTKPMQLQLVPLIYVFKRAGLGWLGGATVNSEGEVLYKAEATPI